LGLRALAWELLPFEGELPRFIFFLDSIAAFDGIVDA
jgi:hypothetical protein